MQDPESIQINHRPELTDLAPRSNDLGSKVVPEVTCEKSEDTGNRELWEKVDPRDLKKKQVRPRFGSTPPNEADGIRSNIQDWRCYGPSPQDDKPGFGLTDRSSGLPINPLG